MMKLSIVAAVLMALTETAAAQARLTAEQNGMQLDCKPQYASSADRGDPITIIKLTLSDSKPQIVHVAQSGRTFNRAEQYSQTLAQWADGQFSWKGKNNKKPSLTMVGTLKAISDEPPIFAYTESLFDAAAANAKTFEMFSVCRAPQPAATKAVAAPAPAVSGPQRAGELSPAEAQADAQHPFEFRRVLLDASREATEACFRFSRPLDPRAEAHYGDYVKLEPPIAIALHVVGTDLCLAGLDKGTDYSVTLAKGLPAKTGERTTQAEKIDVNLGDKPALISIAGDGYILPRNTSNGLAIQTVNIDRVKVRVLRMSDRLLTTSKDVFASPSNDEEDRYYRYQRNLHSLENGGLYRYQLREFVNKEASLVWSGTMDITRDHNRTVQTAFPLAGVIKSDQPGAYLVIAEDEKHATPDTVFNGGPHDENSNPDWREENAKIPAHWVMVTDIALSAMSGADGLHVAVRSLKSAEPLRGVKLALIATGQDLIAQTASDGGGLAAFAPGLLRGHGAAAADTVLAYGEQGDFAMLDLNRAAFDLSDRGVSGRPSPGQSEAFLYVERGVYRPGESVEVMALLRDRMGDALTNAPLTLVVRRPDGVEARRIFLEPQAEGGFHHTEELSKTAAFGSWSLEALVDPAGQPIGRVQFSVQDFVPQTLKVTLKPQAQAIEAGAPIALTVDGQFLYGAPAAGLTGEAELHLVRDEAPVANAKGYSFGLIDEKIEDKAQSLDMAPADEAGHVAITDSVEVDDGIISPLKAVITAGLFEPSGRLVQDKVELPVRTLPLLIGLKPRFADNRTEEGRNAIVDVRVFDAEGKAIAKAGLHWSLVRESRHYDWFEMNDVWRWHYHTVDEEVASGNLNVGQGTPAALSQSVSYGQYRLVVNDPESKAATSIRFVAGWAETAQSADTPDKVEVTLEKPTFSIGETVRLKIKGPFAGKALVTMAGDRVFETREIEVSAEGTTLEVKPGADWASGAYAIVELYRPLALGRPHDPVRAVGLAWIGIDPGPRTLALAIDAPEKITPRQRVEVSLSVDGVKAGERAFVTLAAVDEGILQLTRYETPDPVQFLFGKRRLGIDIRDDYGRLLDGSADSGTIREGGDGPIGGQPLEVSSTRTVALFSGPLLVDKDGTVKVGLDIPDFEGQLRLMAVAYTHHAAGKAERPLIVRDPVIADVSLPRFLAPGDEARLALSLHNTDGKPGTYHLDLSAEGAAALNPDHPLDYRLAVGERKQDAVNLRAVDAGISTIRADLTGPNGYRVHREWQIAVRSPHYPLAIEETARQAPGESFSLDDRRLEGLVPGSVSVSLGYASFAGIDVASLLQSLNRYPYGCTEQITSIAFPLLYYNDPTLLGRPTKDETVKSKLKSAIATLLDRQDTKGKFGLWQANDGLASVWLNVYAIDFLQHAREAGYAVEDSAMQRGFAFLLQALPKLDQENEGWYSEGADATRAYALYVIARAGRADPKQLRYIHDTIASTKLSSGLYQPASIHWQANSKGDSLASAMSLGQLGGALIAMGDRARGHDAFEMALANLGVTNHPGWWSYNYYSEVQDAAALVAIAAEVGDEGIAQRALQRLVALKLSSENLNTQEKAWILAAAHALNKEDSGHALAVNGTALPKLKLPFALAPSIADLHAGMTIVNTGSRDLWRTLVIRGAPTNAPSAMEAGYSLTKSYLTLDGKPLDPSHLRQNDRLIVSIEGKNTDTESHQSVLVDMLPAGWEIEGSVAVGAKADPDSETSDDETAAAHTSQDYAFLGPLTNAFVTEARDDRFVAAFDLGKPRSAAISSYFARTQGLAEDAFHLAYIVRVVTPGRFVLPEAIVEDMYRPGLMARTGSSQTVADPR
jgi:uncharacterized protein YfaS (alpha-2-macroglobulin family)